MDRNARENAFQVAGLLIAVIGGFVVWDWAGVLVGFLLFTVAIVIRVRFKMAKAQEIGKQRKAERDAERNANP